MKRILFVLACLCLPLQAAGTTYYVRQSGNDNASGTSWSTAWRTVNKVNLSVSSGDSVVFGSGAFCGYTLRPAGGTLQNPTYYTCSSLVKMPTISPGDSLTDSSWVPLGNGDYRTVMSTWDNTDLAFLWVDGDFLLRVHSRLPGDGEFGLYNDTVYLDPPGTLSPNLRSVWGLKANVGVNMQGARYTYFYGLRICAVYRAAFYHEHLDDAVGVTIRNCVMEYGCTHTGYNGAFIFSTRASTGAPKDWRIVKNTFGECIAIGNNADLEDGGGITDWEFPSVNSAAIMLYSAHRWVIDSNQFNGGGYWGSIDFKAAYEDTQEEIVDSVLVAYNWFNENRVTGLAMRLYGTYRHVYTICNVFRDTTEANISSATGAGAVEIETGSSPNQNGGASYFYNNTFYQPSKNYGTTTFPSGIADGIFWKYNIIAPRGISTAGLEFPVSSTAPELWVADSNQYYSPIGYNFRIGGSLRTWSQWQAEGYDVHSVRLDPQFASPGIDFTPANAQPGPRTFVQSWWPYAITVGQYGAIQNTGDPCFGSLIWSRPSQGSVTMNESVRWLVEGRFSFPVDSFRLGFDVTKLRAGGADGNAPYHLMDVDSVTFTGSLGAAVGANTLVCSPTGYPDSFVVKIIPSSPLPPDSGLLFSVWTTPVQTGTMPLQILDNLSRSTCTGAIDFAPTGYFNGNSLCHPTAIQLSLVVQSEQSAGTRGDINLNTVPNEVSDALIYAKYFIQGLGVFNIDATAQVGATDINADGFTLGASDLVYLIRIINGDA